MLVISIIVITIIALMLLFLYSACKLSSICSREEEEYLDE